HGSCVTCEARRPLSWRGWIHRRRPLVMGTLTRSRPSECAATSSLETASGESHARWTEERLALPVHLAARERLQVANDLPALRVGQRVLPRRHPRPRDAARDPVVDLALRVLRYVKLEVHRPRLKQERLRSVAESPGAMTDGAIRLERRAPRVDRLGRVRRRVLS